MRSHPFIEVTIIIHLLLFLQFSYFCQSAMIQDVILWLKRPSSVRFTEAVSHWLNQASASTITASQTRAPVATVIFFIYTPSHCSVCRGQWNLGHYDWGYCTERPSMKQLDASCFYNYYNHHCYHHYYYYLHLWASIWFVSQHLPFMGHILGYK